MPYRVGQRIRVDRHHEMVVCDVREDGTAYATSSDIENTRCMIADKGEDVVRIETQVAGRCKCMASTYDEHLTAVNAGFAAPHVYRGFFWQTQNDGSEQ